MIYYKHDLLYKLNIFYVEGDKEQLNSLIPVFVQNGFPEEDIKGIFSPDIEETSGETHFMAHNGYAAGIIWLKRLDREVSENIATLCHEAFHLADEALSFAGLNRNSETSEAYAYYIGYLVNIVLDAAYYMDDIVKLQEEKGG